MTTDYAEPWHDIAEAGQVMMANVSVLAKLPIADIEREPAAESGVDGRESPSGFTSGTAISWTKPASRPSSGRQA